MLEKSDEDTYVINSANAEVAASLFYQSPLRKDVIKLAEIDMKVQRLYEDGDIQGLKQFLSQHLEGYLNMDGKVVYREASCYG